MVVVPAELVRHLEAERIREDSLNNIKIAAEETDDNTRKQQTIRTILKELGFTPATKTTTTSSTAQKSTLSPPSTPMTTSQSLITPSLTADTIPTTSFQPQQSPHTPLYSTPIDTFTHKYKPNITFTSPIQPFQSHSQIWNEIKEAYFDKSFLVNPYDSRNKKKVNLDLIEKFLFDPDRNMREPAGVQELARFIKNSEFKDTLSFSSRFNKLVKGTRKSPINVRTPAKDKSIKRLNQTGKGKWIRIH